MNCPQAGCLKHFSSKYNLDRHFNAQHLKIRPHFCQFCFRSFASKQNRLTHEYRHRSPPEAPIPVNARDPQESYETRIESLTAMLKTCRDPDLRPYAKIVKVYYWPDEGNKVSLPALLTQTTERTVDLPKLT
jgi:hypothetical protein